MEETIPVTREEFERFAYHPVLQALGKDERLKGVHMVVNWKETVYNIRPTKLRLTIELHEKNYSLYSRVGFQRYWILSKKKYKLFKREAAERYEKPEEVAEAIISKFVGLRNSFKFGEENNEL